MLINRCNPVAQFLETEHLPLYNVPEANPWLSYFE